MVWLGIPHAVNNNVSLIGLLDDSIKGSFSPFLFDVITLYWFL